MARSGSTARKKRAAKIPRSTAPPAKSRRSAAWPILEAFLDSEEGTITLGSIDHGSAPGYVAVASDHHDMLVALVRRPKETLHQLLARLEKALGPALEDQVYVDEINGPI